MASNKIFQSTNYAFYIPKSKLQEAMSWWMQHHYSVCNNVDVTFDYVIHPVTGCQTNDHTKWLINSKDYDYQIVKENLLCCHNGPSACTCDIVTYQLYTSENKEEEEEENNNADEEESKCLTISFDEDNTNKAQFKLDTCEGEKIWKNNRVFRIFRVSSVLFEWMVFFFCLCFILY